MTPSRIVSFGVQPSARILRAVEEDERVVADPAALAAGVARARAQTRGAR